MARPTRSLIDARYGLDDFLRESATDGADSHDGSRLDGLDPSDENVRRRMSVSPRASEVDEVRASRLQQAIDVEHVDPRLSLFKCLPFLGHRRAQEVGEANAGRARAQEQVLLIAQLSAVEFGGVEIIRASTIPAVPCTSSL